MRPEITAPPFGAAYGGNKTMTTGQKIARLRRERGMTQDGLADALGVSRQAVSKWESDAAFPETEKLVRLSRLLECSIDYLLKQEDEPAQEKPDAASERGGAAGLFLALGAVALGFIAYGAVAVGFFSAGALAVAQFVAVGDYAFAAVPIGKTVSSGGALYNFYMAMSQLPPFSRVGYYEGGAFVEGEAALARAITELVPPFLRPLAELFASYRIY